MEGLGADFGAFFGMQWIWSLLLCAAMPRASRYLLEGYTYHLTQRCTNRDFRLRFGRDRDAWREWLRVAVRRHRVPVYGYCATSTHIHLLVHADDVTAVGMLMDLVAGATAQQYNRRKGRSGAFWEPYQCTIIQDGRHLFNCLRYIDLNMVRAGVVGHPRDWRWCGWAELMGERQRYRLLDLERLLHSLDISDLDTFRLAYAQAVEVSLCQRRLKREAIWSESLAVGSERFVNDVSGQFKARYHLQYDQITSPTGGDLWTVKETVQPYSTIPYPE